MMSFTDSHDAATRERRIFAFIRYNLEHNDLSIEKTNITD